MLKIETEYSTLEAAFPHRDLTLDHGQHGNRGFVFALREGQLEAGRDGPPAQRHYAGEPIFCAAPSFVPGNSDLFGRLIG